MVFENLLTNISNEVKQLINEESYLQKRKNEFLNKVNKVMLGELAIVLIEMSYDKEKALNIFVILMLGVQTAKYLEKKKENCKIY